MAKAEDIDLDSTSFHCNVVDRSHISEHPGQVHFKFAK